MMNEYLISDPAERTRRAIDKESRVLCFLRDEVYSTTSILALVMGVGERAARTVLNRMEKKGLLLKDAVQFMGMKAVPLWGITSTGILHNLTPEQVAIVNLRYHSPGSVKALTIAHTLDTQECRLYCERELQFKGWTPDRLLPGKGLKKSDVNRWDHYPDGLGEVMQQEKQITYKVAIEIERTRKTPGRYIDVVKAHLRNIQKGRYARVWYFCSTQNDANSLQALFLRLMKEKDIGYWPDASSKYLPEQSIKLFKFRSIKDFK
jgi:hypothetical protein